MYKHEQTVRLRDTDSAGVVFFARYYELAHSAYESFLESIGFPIERFLIELNYMPLIVHSEADYKISLRSGEKIQVEIEVTSIGVSSYTLEYKIINQAGEVAATLKTVHVTIDSTSKKKTDIPEEFKKQLSC